MKTFLLASFIIAAASAASIDLKDDIEIRDCGKNKDSQVKLFSFVHVTGSKVEIQRIEFDQCSDFPCVVHHGQSATGRATMVANSATDTLTCKVLSRQLNHENSISVSRLSV